MTAVGQPTARSADNAPTTAAAPDMSFFMVACTASPGLRLMPPESYMIPLPTMERWGVSGPAPSGR